MQNIQYISLSELWIEFGVGKHLQYLPAHDISRSISEEKSLALSAFHAFKDCDQTSSFDHYGKKTARGAWVAFNDVTAAFQALSNAPTVDVVNEVMPILERYVTITFDRTSTCMKLNDGWAEGPIPRKGRDIKAIPPTSDASRQHAKRSTTRLATAEAIPWCRLLRYCVHASECGRVKVANDMWVPLWMTISQASQSCQELLKGGFKSGRGCAGRWKSVKAEPTVHSTVQLRWAVRPRMNNRMLNANKPNRVSLALLTTFL